MASPREKIFWFIAPIKWLKPSFVSCDNNFLLSSSYSFLRPFQLSLDQSQWIDPVFFNCEVLATLWVISSSCNSLGFALNSFESPIFSMIVYSMSFTCCPLCLSSVLNPLNEHLLLQLSSPSVGVWFLSHASMLLLRPQIQAYRHHHHVKLKRTGGYQSNIPLHPFLSTLTSYCPELFGSSHAGPHMCRRFSVLMYTAPLALAPLLESPC